MEIISHMDILPANVLIFLDLFLRIIL